MKNIFYPDFHLVADKDTSETHITGHELDSLNLSLRPGEIHAVISNSPTELSKLWDLICAYKEHDILKPEAFFSVLPEAPVKPVPYFICF